MSFIEEMNVQKFMLLDSEKAVARIASLYRELKKEFGKEVAMRAMLDGAIVIQVMREVDEEQQNVTYTKYAFRVEDEYLEKLKRKQ